MVRWLADSVPAWLLGLTLCLVIPALLVLAEHQVHKRLPHWREGRHNDATAIVMSVVAVVYSITVALCVVTLWDHYGEAHAATEDEAAVLVGMAENSVIVDRGVAVELRKQVIQYNQDVIDNWQDRVDGKRIPGVSADLAAIRQTVADIKPETEAQKAFVEDAVNRLAQVTERRHTVIRMSTDEQLPSLLWVCILVGSVAVLLLWLACGVEDNLIRGLLTVGVGTVVAVNLFLVIELNYPFLGDIAIQPEAYQRVVDELRSVG